jgi:hypothetical protein
MYVPYQLERLMWIGTLLCVASFLVRTSRPPASRSRPSFHTSCHNPPSSPPSPTHPTNPQASLTLLPLRCLRALYNVATSRGRPDSGCRLLPGHQLYDVIASALLVAAAACLTLLRPGLIYYWMKDITSEFLKIHVLFNALEILDKVGNKARAGVGGWGLGVGELSRGRGFLVFQGSRTPHTPTHRTSHPTTCARSSPTLEWTSWRPSPAPAPSTAAAASAPPRWRPTRPSRSC